MEKSHLTGKKLLIIGGAFQHCKLVEAAHKLGAIAYVVDYLPLERAPAKQIADRHYEYNITDYDKIEALCRSEKIDGAIASHLDACQIPYMEICERLGFPCFGTREQYRILTDKTAFIEKCIECGVDVIPQYREEEFSNRETCRAEFPIFVKPCDSRGSRGQTICSCFDEVADAIAFAKSESKTGKAVIEKFMGGKQDFSTSYLVVNGEPILVRSGDRYLGSHEDKMDKSAICGVSPSSNRELYFKSVHDKVVNFICKVGIRNGPVFVQGFIDGDKIRFYDPGLRFPGIEYDRMVEKATGVNLCEYLVEFALTGKMPEECTALDRRAELCGKHVANLFLVLKPGRIARIEGLEKVRSFRQIVSDFQKAYVGDVIEACYNVNQRLGEFDIVAGSIEELCEVIDKIYETIHVYDSDGNDMIFAKFDTALLNQ